MANILRITWFSYLGMIAILCVVRYFTGDASGGTHLLVVAIVAHVLFLCVVLAHSQKPHSAIFAVALVVRFLVIASSVFFGDHLTIPHSGNDTERYYTSSITASNDLAFIHPQTDDAMSRDAYVRITGLLFYFIGPQRMVAEYANTLLGFSTVIVIASTLQVMKIRSRTRTLILLISALLPTSVFLSALLLREMVPTFFVALSLYYFVQTFYRARQSDYVLSIVFLGVSSVFHAGVAPLCIGYVMGFACYTRTNGKFALTANSLLAAGLTCCIIALPAIVNHEFFFAKSERYQEVDDIIVASNSRDGGAAYLIGQEVTGLRSLLMYVPIRMVYFIGAPMPFDWRGGMDAFAFCTSSILFLGVLIHIAYRWRAIKTRKGLAISLLIALAGALAIFGIGVSNAGTAIRHRQKFIAVFLVLWAIALDSNRRLGRSE